MRRLFQYAILFIADISDRAPAHFFWIFLPCSPLLSFLRSISSWCAAAGSLTFKPYLYIQLIWFLDYSNLLSLLNMQFVSAFTLKDFSHHFLKLLLPDLADCVSILGLVLVSYSVCIRSCSSCFSMNVILTFYKEICNNIYISIHMFNVEFPLRRMYHPPFPFSRKLSRCVWANSKKEHIQYGSAISIYR